MKEILERVVEILSSGQRAALAGVVAARGSLPMSRRARMLILEGGAQLGTVGGGCLEAEVHAMGARAIASGLGVLRRFTLTEQQAGAEGLNCGGTVEILVEPVGGTAPEGCGHDLFAPALKAIDDREETVLATVLELLGPDGSIRIAGRALIGWKGIRRGAGLLDPAGSPARLIEHACEEALAVLGQDRAALVDPPAGPGCSSLKLFLETLDAPPLLYLFGGGHVGLAVARVARTAGFRVIVIDDREAFANPGRFPDADRTLVLPMEGAFASLTVDRNTYILALTRGHRHDEPVIEQAIRTPARYIGMLGSRRKVAIMRERLAAAGATPEQLDRVHSPVGLTIGADTPGEIAVSIVAQMIANRRLPAD
ncbi:MAG TPA: XdhC family protein [Candidatus Polarisedimenticolia bacterium]|nr:XdhC family protein [Candidatus Polarisedimenticolia bacterium]